MSVGALIKTNNVIITEVCGQQGGQKAELNPIYLLLNRDDKAVKSTNDQKKMDGNCSILQWDHISLLRAEDCGFRPEKEQTVSGQWSPKVSKVSVELSLLLIPCNTTLIPVKPVYVLESYILLHRCRRYIRAGVVLTRRWRH